MSCTHWSENFDGIVQDPKQFGSDLVQGGQPTSVYWAIGLSFVVVVLIIYGLGGPSSKKVKDEDDDDVENPKEQLLSTAANISRASSRSKFAS